MAALPEGALMQRASFGLATTCTRLLSEVRGRVVGARVCILAGSGGNGGDALWAGALLATRGCDVRILRLGERLHEAGVSAALRAGARLVDSVTADCDLVLDGIVGIGGRGPLRPHAVQAVAQAMRSGALIVAVDVPSGVDADTGLACDGAVMADVTVTFGCLKPGVMLNPQHSGHVEVIDIGLGKHDASVYVMQAGDVAPFVPGPYVADYKYSRGVAGVAAGSVQYPGAGVLCVLGARHADIGMVHLLDRRDGVAATVVAHCPDVVVDGSDPVEQGRVDAWACGPGFSGAADDESAVLAVLEVDRPVVLDAGALSVLARSPEVRTAAIARADRGAFTLVTPHEGEFARLASAVDAVTPAQAGRLAAACDLATRLRCTVLLKGPGTVIAAADGQAWIDAEGTEALGTAGSGDVLTGILVAVLAGAWARNDRDDLIEAVAAGVWLHGCAGRLAPSPATAVDIARQVRAAVGVAREASS